PGLRIKVDADAQQGGAYDAHRITFTKADLKVARAIDPTDMRSRMNSQAIDAHAKLLAQQRQTLTEQEQQIAANEARIKENDEKIVATSGALDATNARISNLNEYYVIDTITVYFANGKSSISPKTKTALHNLTAQAKSMTGYKVQVQGYASAVGDYTFNQKLSMQRA